MGRTGSMGYEEHGCRDGKSLYRRRDLQTHNSHSSSNHSSSRRNLHNI